MGNCNTFQLVLPKPTIELTASKATYINREKTLTFLIDYDEKREVKIKIVPEVYTFYDIVFGNDNHLENVSAYYIDYLNVSYFCNNMPMQMKSVFDIKYNGTKTADVKEMYFPPMCESSQHSGRILQSPLKDKPFIEVYMPIEEDIRELMPVKCRDSNDTWVYIPLDNRFYTIFYRFHESFMSIL
jgi:hypothetical protein